MTELDLSPEMVNNALTLNFTGADDEYLDFQGNNGVGNLIQMKDTVRRATYSFKNTTESQKRVALTPANFDTRKAMLVYDDSGILKVKVPGGGAVAVTEFDSDAVENDIVSINSSVNEINNAGFNVDAMFDDGIVYAEAADPTKYVKVKSNSKDYSANHFKRFIQANPTAFVGMHIVSDKIEMYESEMIQQDVTPFKGAGQQKRIPFQDYFTSKAMNVDKIEVNENYQFDGQTLSQIVLPASSSVTITFVASVVQSNAAALKRKVQKARIFGKHLERKTQKIGQPAEKRFS